MDNSAVRERRQHSDSECEIPDNVSVDSGYASVRSGESMSPGDERFCLDVSYAAGVIHESQSEMISAERWRENRDLRLLKASKRPYKTVIPVKSSKMSSVRVFGGWNDEQSLRRKELLLRRIQPTSRDYVQTARYVQRSNLYQKEMSRQSTTLSDKDFLEMAKKIGPEWKELGISLGFSSEEICKMEMDQAVDLPLRLLLKWKSRQDRSEDHILKLCNALANIGRADLVFPLQHQTDLTRIIFDRTAELLGPEWRELALIFGFSSAEINSIWESNPDSSRGHSLLMLRKWKERVDITADQLGQLCDALTYIGKQDIAHHLRRYRAILLSSENGGGTESNSRLKIRETLSSSFWKIAAKVKPSDWVKLSLLLGVSKADTETVRECYPHDWRSQCYSMLKIWRRHQSVDEDEILKKLRDAMKKIGKKDVAILLPHRPALSDDVLGRIARKLGPKWREMAIILGLNSDEIRSKERGGPSCDLAFDILKEWNSRQGRKVDQFGKLCDVLANIDRTDLISLLLHHTDLRKEVLSRVAEEVAYQWEELALLLDVSVAEINSIRTDNPNSLRPQSLAMLRKWKHRVDVREDQFGRLCTALADIGRKDLVVELQHYRVFREPVLYDIALLVGRNDCAKLADNLGFTSTEIDVIKADIPGDWKGQCCSMLVKWRHRQSEKDEQCVEKLCTALTEIGRKGSAMLLQLHRVSALTSADVGEKRDDSKQTGEVTIYSTLREVAEDVGRRDWVKLASVLGISKEETDLIKELHPHERHRHCYSMLLIWKHRQEVLGDGILKKLCRALNEIGRDDLEISLQLRPELNLHKELESTEASPTAPQNEAEFANANGPESEPMRSRLEIVLDEHSKRTEGLSDKERLETLFQLPDISIGYFDHKGGSLSLNKYGVRLHIPPDAIAPGPPQKIYIAVDPTLPTVEGLESGEVSISLVVECGPDGVKFQKSVVLSFPHHAAKTTAQQVKPGVRMRHDDSETGKWDKFDGNFALMNNEKIILLVRHFTKYTAVGVLSLESTKQLMVGAFGNKVEPGSRRYTLRVHAWDDNPVAKQDVLTAEKGNDALDVFRPFEFTRFKSDLTVKVLNIAGDWKMRNESVQSISEEAVWKFPLNSTTFHLNRSGSGDCTADGDLSCDIDIYQGEEQAGSLKTHLSPYPEVKKQRDECASTIPGQSVKPSEQNSPSTSCDSSTAKATAPCSKVKALKEEIGKAFSKRVHGEADIVEYIGCCGLSEHQLMDLCEHLDADRVDGKNWIKLAEFVTGKGYRFIEKAKHMKHPTKELLATIFEVCKTNGSIGSDALTDLIELLEGLGLDRAVEILTTKPDGSPQSHYKALESNHMLPEDDQNMNILVANS